MAAKIAAPINAPKLVAIKYFNADFLAIIFSIFLYAGSLLDFTTSPLP
jgi:hypothetical protein